MYLCVCLFLSASTVFLYILWRVNVRLFMMSPMLTVYYLSAIQSVAFYLSSFVNFCLNLKLYCVTCGSEMCVCVCVCVFYVPRQRNTVINGNKFAAVAVINETSLP